MSAGTITSNTITDWQFGRVIRNLAIELGAEVRRGDGSGLRGAIVHLRSGIHLLVWSGLPLLTLERIEDDAIDRPDGFGPLSPMHPPNFDLSRLDILAAPRFPFTIKYSVSAGPLAGRAGTVTVRSESEFEFAHMVVS